MKLMMNNPLINITLQGRTDTYAKRHGITRVKELWQAGLNVSLGHDCIQDPWILSRQATYWMSRIWLCMVVKLRGWTKFEPVMKW